MMQYDAIFPRKCCSKIVIVTTSTVQRIAIIMESVYEWVARHLPQGDPKSFENHVSIAESTKKKADDGCSVSKGLAVYAAKCIRGGDPVISVPMECLLTPFSVPKELHPAWHMDHWRIQVPGSCVPDSSEGYPIKLTHAGMTVFALLVEYQKGPKDSFYAPYIQSLPERVPVPTRLVQNRGLQQRMCGVANGCQLQSSRNVPG
eukprot:gb/GECG01011945.1/.p1 GENE.gb/GECG01011945.1/~~gb/GECG01011945.1/.p1  ORF type:complete len:203 (+),score=11.47 gb/GECG01011945.1/:1-609(+)